MLQRFLYHGANGIGALVSRGLIVIATVVVLPLTLYLVMQVLDRSESTYEQMIEVRSDVRSIEHQIYRVDQRLDRMDRRVIHLERDNGSD